MKTIIAFFAVGSVCYGQSYDWYEIMRNRAEVTRRHRLEDNYREVLEDFGPIDRAKIESEARWREESREWKNSKGVSLGFFIFIESGSVVILQTEEGKNIRFSFSRFSEGDRKWIRSTMRQKVAAARKMKNQ